MSKTETPAAANTPSTATEEVVHTLWAGRPPCGFTSATPNHWPEGHSMAHHWQLDDVTCPACKDFASAKVRELAEER